MNEETLKPPPPDTIIRTLEGRFQGSAYLYGPDFEIKELKFDSQPNKPLEPFYYNKPDTSNPPNFTKDEKPRTEVYPVAIAREARRSPTHLYEADDAIIAAVNTGSEEEQKWETRYFPKSCIDEGTWKQAMEILGIRE